MPQPYSLGPTLFLYVKIPNIPGAESQYLDRDDAMDQILRERGMGSVLGWGDSLGGMRPDGSRPVAFHRVDVEVNDLTSARLALHEILPALNVPSGTEIHYTLGGQKFQDVYSLSGWLLEQPLSSIPGAVAKVQP